MYRGGGVGGGVKNEKPKYENVINYLKFSYLSSFIALGYM